MHPTSILDVYKVFKHLEMMWMGILVYPYSRNTCAGGGDFLRKWCMAEPVCCCGIMVEAANPH